MDSAYLRAFGIGAVAGLRSMTAPAAALLACEHPAAGAAIFAAAGELVVDKLPIAPARTFPPSLAFRLLAGGASGGAIARRFEGSRALGIVAGTAGALAATYLGYAVRRALTQQLRWPDFPVALAEDALALWGARAAGASNAPT